MIGFPSILTFLLPFEVSEDFEMFGYGIGMGLGEGGAGVLQTSGKALAIPELLL